MSIYNKGQTSLTKTGILLTLLVFYAVLFVLIGFSHGSTQIIEHDGISKYSVLGFSTFGFLGDIFSGISELPWWINSIIFTPLVIIIAWIVVSSLPTFNGGG